MQSQDLRMAKGKKTKEKLLLVALNIMAESGIKNLSAGKLAIKASVSKSTIFHHFGNIEDIPLEILRYLAKRVVQPMEVLDFRTLEAYFEHLGRTTFFAKEENLKYNRAFFSFYNEASYASDQRYKELLNACSNQFIEHMKSIIQKVEHINISEQELYNICKAIAITIDGFGIHFLVDQDPEEYAMLWNGMSTVLCQYIRSRAQQTRG